MGTNGELVNEGLGANLRTTRTFEDFKLHVEYYCPEGENSGIYLRGRYEAQVAPPGARRAEGGPRGIFPRNPFRGVGSIYGMLGPASPPPFRPDWQTYDITLIGRWVTVVFNGVTTVYNQEIPGITGECSTAARGCPARSISRATITGGSATATSRSPCPSAEGGRILLASVIWRCWAGGAPGAARLKSGASPGVGNIPSVPPFGCGFEALEEKSEARDQNMKRKASWKWRSVPETVESTRPKLASPWVVPGKPNLGVLVKLKASARNWKR